MKIRTSAQILTISLVLCLLAVPGLGQITVTDISPNRPFGATDSDLGPQGFFATTGGRVEGLAQDPTNDSVLYAASEWAGVWKTTDAAHTWFQSSYGLRSGISVQGYNGGAVIAVDAVNPQRLLYAVQDKDARTGSSQGGLWVSLDGASTWKRATLPCASTNPAVKNVVFAGATPYVLIQASSCGIYKLWTSSDPNLQTWIPLIDPAFPDQLSLITTAKGSSTVLGCSGSLVYANASPAAGNPWQSITLSGSCMGLAAVPPPPGAEVATQALVLTSDATSQLVVLIVDFSAGSVTSLPAVGPSGGSGTVSVWAAPFQNPYHVGPGLSYDIFVGDGFHFHYYDAFEQRWIEVYGQQIGKELHADTWAMAFPAIYDRVNGICYTYLTTDGGVFTNSVTNQQGKGGCTILGPTVDWEFTSSGLHVIDGDVNGVSHNYYPSVPCPMPTLSVCPTLYLSADDNDVWALDDGGFAGHQWQWAGFSLGDGDEVWVDPIHPGAAMGIRNGTYNLMGGGGQFPAQQPPFYPDPVIGNFNPPLGFQGIATPFESGILQVMTVPSDLQFPVYDYVAIGSTCDTCTANDVVLRLISPLLLPAAPGNWQPLSSFFARTTDANGNYTGQIGGLAASGGHENLTVYVLTANDIEFDPNTGIGPGQVWRGDVGVNGTIPGWIPVMGTSTAGLGRAYNLIVNPYDKNELYATDLSSRTIKTSRDGGKSWHTDTTLTNIASNYGEFLISCGLFGAWGPDGFWDKEIFGSHCSLADVAFEYSTPNVRVATLYPGGVAFSRDGGQHWIPLDVTNNRVSTAKGPIDLPATAFYDPAPSPYSAYPSIYLSLQGHGAERLNGPFPTLGYTQFICTVCRLPRSGSAWVIVPSLGLRAPLQQDSDQVFRANLPFDMASVKKLSYYFLIDGQAGPVFTHTITGPERRSGTLTLSDTAENEDQQGAQ